MLATEESPSTKENIKSISDWEVYTPTGWQDFEGIKKVTKSAYLKITFEVLVEGEIIQKEIACSSGHQFLTRRFGTEVEFCFAELLDPEVDEICHLRSDMQESEIKSTTDKYDFCRILTIQKIEEEIDLYDLVNVNNGYSFISDGVVSHNCAWIDNIDELWVGLQPTLSCIAGDTLIFTKDGLVPIEDFHKSKNSGEFFDIEIPIYGKYGMEKTSKGYISPESETRIIRTKHGHKIEATLKHPLFTLRNESRGEMISTSQLAIGDFLRVQLGQEAYGTKQLSPDLAYILGGYIAEGWFIKHREVNKQTLYNGVAIENSDDGFRDVFLKSDCLEKLFHASPSRNTRLLCYSSKFVKDLIELGLEPEARCYEKTTPCSILQGTKSTIANYMAGLFDGDGCVTENGIVLSSTSEKLINETNVMLHNMGFISNASKAHTPKHDIGKRIMPQGRVLQSLRDSWRLVIPRSQYKKWADEIGFRIKRKQDKLEKLAELYLQDERKLKPIPVKYISSQIKELQTKSGKSKEWFRNQGLRFDKCLDKNSDTRFINQNWLSRFKEILETKLQIRFNQQELEFFNEHLGNFYWDEIVAIEKSRNVTYDFTVPETHTFLQNGLLGSNTGGDVIFISSPSGVGTFFHNMWVEATSDEKNEDGEGKNGFYAIELPWMVHPERDQKWFEEQRQALLPAMGERGISQELLCQFGTSGHTFIGGDTMDLLFSNVQEPVEKRPVFLANQGSTVWLWKYPIPDHKYLIGADVASGQGDDNSAFHIIDTNTDEVVADFAGKITPDKFANVLLEWGSFYCQALISQELNNHGLLTAHVLKESKYPNLYYANRQENIYGGYQGAINEDDVPGFVTTVSNRDEILIRLENALRNKLLRVYSKRLFTELQTFIYKKNQVSGKEKVQARKGHNDDLVMALAIACTMFEAKGKTGYGTDTDAMWALVKGMSRNVQTMNTTTGKTSDGLFSAPKVNTRPTTPDGDFIERSPADSLCSGGRIDYAQPFWRQWKWVND